MEESSPTFEQVVFEVGAGRAEQRLGRAGLSWAGLGWAGPPARQWPQPPLALPCLPPSPARRPSRAPQSCRADSPAAGQGGGLYITGFSSNVLLKGSKFESNFANSGGGLYVKWGTVTTQACEFQRNDATPFIGQGGGVYLERTAPTFFRNTIFANSAWVWRRRRRCGGGMGQPAGCPLCLP